MKFLLTNSSKSVRFMIKLLSLKLKTKNNLQINFSSRLPLEVTLKAFINSSNSIVPSCSIKRMYRKKLFSL